MRQKYLVNFILYIIEQNMGLLKEYHFFVGETNPKSFLQHQEEIKKKQ